MQEGYGSHHFSVEVAALSVSCLDVRYYSQSRRRGQSPRGIAFVDLISNSLSKNVLCERIH